MPNESSIESITEQFYREVGSSIRQVRRSKGMTQESLAESVGLKRTSLINIEKGRQRILLHTFVELTSKLQVPPSHLLPHCSKVLNDLGVSLPDTLQPDERQFITRTVSRGVEHAKITDKKNPKPRKTDSKKR